MKKKRELFVAVVRWILRRSIVIGLCFAIIYLQLFVEWLDKDKDFDTIHSPVGSPFLERNREETL